MQCSRLFPNNSNLSELIVALLRLWPSSLTRSFFLCSDKKNRSFSCEWSRFHSGYQPSNSAERDSYWTSRIWTKIRRLLSYSAIVNGGKMYCWAANCHAEIISWHNNDSECFCASETCSIVARRQPGLKEISCLCILCSVDFSEVAAKTLKVSPIEQHVITFLQAAEQ